jgi:hypothetical protein
MANLSQIKISPETKGNPVYEVIKKEDIEGAFRDALNKVLPEVVDKLDNLIDVISSVTPTSLWTWGYTSRWGFDKWY